MGIPSPLAAVKRLLERGSAARRTADLLPVGTEALEYVKECGNQINAENVDGFVMGTGTMSVLVQEVILRVAIANRQVGEGAKSEAEKSYAEGASDAIMAITTLLARTADPIIAKAIEGPAVDREFNNIVNNNA